MHTQPSKPSAFLSVAQVADHLSVCTKTVRRMIKDQQLRCHRIGQSVRVSQEDLRAFLNSRRE